MTVWDVSHELLGRTFLCGLRTTKKLLKIKKKIINLGVLQP